LTGSYHHKSIFSDIAVVCIGYIHTNTKVGLSCDFGRMRINSLQILCFDRMIIKAS